MNFDPILIVHGEPNSIFSEILFKSLKKLKIKKPVILISSLKLLKLQMKKLNYNKNIKLLDHNNLKKYELNNNSINLIDVDFSQKKIFQKISKKSNNFIRKSFNIAFKLIEKEKITKLINGPISKKNFLGKKYLGITEYISSHYSKKNTSMLIYNKDLSVSTITTHLPLKFVPKNINRKNIVNKIKLIQEFYLHQFKIRPRIGVLGLNPHCESIAR